MRYSLFLQSRVLPLPLLLRLFHHLLLFLRRPSVASLLRFSPKLSSQSSSSLSPRTLISRPNSRTPRSRTRSSRSQTRTLPSTFSQRITRTEICRLEYNTRSRTSRDVLSLFASSSLLLSRFHHDSSFDSETNRSLTQTPVSSRTWRTSKRSIG